MKWLRALSCACWVIAILSVVVMLVIGLATVWAKDGEDLFETLNKPFFTALFLLGATAVTIILNSIIIRSVCSNGGSDKPSGLAYPPDSNP